MPSAFSTIPAVVVKGDITTASSGWYPRIYPNLNRSVPFASGINLPPFTSISKSLKRGIIASISAFIWFISTCIAPNTSFTCRPIVTSGSFVPKYFAKFLFIAFVFFSMFRSFESCHKLVAYSYIASLEFGTSAGLKILATLDSLL